MKLSHMGVAALAALRGGTDALAAFRCEHPELKNIGGEAHENEEVAQEVDVRQHEVIGIDLSKADLSGLLLHSIKFVNCDLRNAGLSKCVLEACSFEGCGLEAANLRRTEGCGMTTFTECDLKTADLRDTNFKNSRFSKCDMRSVDVRDAVFITTHFVECDLRNARLDLTRKFDGCTLKDVQRGREDR